MWMSDHKFILVDVLISVELFGGNKKKNKIYGNG